MKIIYMGTPDFAVEALEALASSRHEVTAVFTQPDKPKGRGKAMQFTPVKEVALRENIPVYQPKKVRDPEVMLPVRLPPNWKSPVSVCVSACRHR